MYCGGEGEEGSLNIVFIRIHECTTDYGHGKNDNVYHIGTTYM